MKVRSALIGAVIALSGLGSALAFADDVCGKVLGPSAPVTLVCQDGYTLGFDGRKKSVTWAAYTVKQGQTVESGAAKAVARSEKVEKSVQVVGGAPEGYRWLALTPDTGLADSSIEVVPVVPSIADEVWPELLRYVSSVAKRYGAIEVVTGVYSELPYEFTPDKQVIPSQIYLAVYVPSKERGMAFLLPNKDLKKSSVYDSLVTIDALEEKVGIELFNTLDGTVERRVESQISVATLW